MQKQLVVTDRPSRKLSYIPVEVVEHFAADGKTVMLNSSNPQAVSMYAGVYRFPVTLEDLDEELVGILKRQGFQQGADNTFHRGDCILLWSNHADIERFREEAEILWHQQSDPSRAADELNMFAKQRLPRGVGFENRTAPPVEEYVFRRSGRSK